jgi:hypothetical protein
VPIIKKRLKKEQVVKVIGDYEKQKSKSIKLDEIACSASIDAFLIELSVGLSDVFFFALSLFLSLSLFFLLLSFLSSSLLNYTAEAILSQWRIGFVWPVRKRRFAN